MPLLKWSGSILLPALLAAHLYAAPVTPDDQSSSLAIHTLQARLEANERAADSLRSQLEQARSEAEARVTAVHAADSATIHQLRTELDAASQSVRAAEQIASAKDSLIGELRARVIPAPRPETHVAAPDGISESVASRRHAETIAATEFTRGEISADIRRLVTDADLRDVRRAQLAADRAALEIRTERLAVIGTCGGVLVVLLMMLNFHLLLQMRRRP